MVPNPAPTNAAPFQAREPAPVYQNLPVACRPGEETVAFMGGLREGNNGMKSRSGPKVGDQPIYKRVILVINFEFMSVLFVLSSLSCFYLLRSAAVFMQTKRH